MTKKVSMFTVDIDGKQFVLADPTIIPDEEIETCLPYLSEIEKVCENLKTYAREKAKKGKAWSGMEYKIRPGNRIFSDPETVKNILTENDRSDLIRPAPLTEIEKEFGTDFEKTFAPFIAHGDPVGMLIRRKK